MLKLGHGRNTYTRKPNVISTDPKYGNIRSSFATCVFDFEPNHTASHWLKVQYVLITPSNSTNITREIILVSRRSWRVAHTQANWQLSDSPSCPCRVHRIVRI